MAIYESGEDYLETILLLSRKSPFVRSIDIANELGYTKPSVSRAVGILKANGFITVAHDGQILLTEAGKAKANGVYERHTIIKKFFEDILKVDESIAEKDACKIEHIISDESYKKWKEFVECNSDL